MSEDRLERALQEMREEDVDSGTLEGARARVWESVTSAGSATQGTPSRRSGTSCEEFRQDFHAYLANELGGSRRILVDDHLSRCTQREEDRCGMATIRLSPFRSAIRARQLGQRLR